MKCYAARVRIDGLVFCAHCSKRIKPTDTAYEVDGELYCSPSCIEQQEQEQWTDYED